MTSFRNQLHPSWTQVMQDLLPLLDEIEEQLRDRNFLPTHENVMKAFCLDLNKCKVLIVGQDPYPGVDHAMGLSFSVPAKVKKIPPTLQNIFKELASDLEVSQPINGDLTHWHEQGVVMLNRTLTCEAGVSNSHSNLGWSQITDRCAQVLGERGVIAVLWGKNAAELVRFFPAGKVITSAHPSPLSAYRGFFGSKPFSSTNRLLSREGEAEIKWIKNSASQD
ncbi:MAG: uracil-DNA glycosylase [Candidatus Planktophila sp.]|nr:uracil-DNA glycosylase [Candidatus Planktophila sp.]